MRIVFAASGNTAVIVPISANIDDDNVTYTYAKTGPNTATASLTYPASIDFPSYQTVYQVSFVSATAGTYAGTIPGTADTQTGTFAIE